MGSDFVVSVVGLAYHQYVAREIFQQAGGDAADGRAQDASQAVGADGNQIHMVLVGVFGQQRDGVADFNQDFRTLAVLQAGGVVQNSSPVCLAAWRKPLMSVWVCSTPVAVGSSGRDRA